ncbi:MAG: hypothetical protein AAB478_00070 [Patescibacteria group bacterium]
MKKTIVTGLISVFTVLLVVQVQAAEPTPEGCQPLFNGGTVCSNSNVLSVNKKVLKPTLTVKPGQKFSDSDFINNIGPNDPAYTANTPAAFRIYLTNKTNSSLKNIVLKDIFPPRYVTYISGDGTFDAQKRVFSTTIGELKAKSTRVVTVQVMTARLEDLPTDNSSLCTINLALVTIDNKTSQDTAQICVTRTEGTSAASSQAGTSAQITPLPKTTKGGLPVAKVVTPVSGQQTPKTGPEMIVLAGLVPTGVLGWLLRRKAA